VTLTAPSAQPPAAAPRPSGLRAILTPGWLGVLALAVVFAGACWFVLAPWQYGRHVERVALNEQIASALAADPVPVGELLTTAAGPPAAAEFRLVTATGSYLADEQVFVRLRQANGTSASEVVVPFELTDGTRMLVNRGYFANDSLTAGMRPADLPPGQVTVTGRVRPDQPDPLDRPRQTADGRVDVYGISSADLLGSAPGARLGFVQLVAGAPGVLDEIGLPDRDGGPFLSYAVQWAVFGAVALLTAGFFAYREVTDPVDGAGYPPAPSDAAAPATAPHDAGTGRPERDGKPRRPKFDKSQLYD
jgi:cytochrome oxidase assembly protein ShyY1